MSTVSPWLGGDGGAGPLPSLRHWLLRWGTLVQSYQEARPERSSALPTPAVSD